MPSVVTKMANVQRVFNIPMECKGVSFEVVFTYSGKFHIFLLDLYLGVTQ